MGRPPDKSNSLPASPAGAGRFRESAVRRPSAIRAGCRHEFCRGAPRCLIEQAVEGLAIGMVLINPQGRLVWLNRAAARLLGLPAEEAVGRPFHQVLRDPRLAAFWHEAGCQTGNCMGDVSVRWPQPLELKLNATSCRDEAGAELGRALLFCDVTTERNVRVELSQAMVARLMSLTAGDRASENHTAELTDGMTGQELKILRLVGRGLGNDRIATELHVAASTVRSHLKHIYRKLHLTRRAEAVSFAVRHGLT